MTDMIEKLKEGYRQWNDTKANSVEYWLNLIADDVKWRSLADGAPGMEFTRSCDCKDDVVGYFQQLGEDWEMIHFTPEDFIAQDDKLVVRSQCEWRHRKTGKTVTTPKADFITFRNGKIVEFVEFYDTAKAFAAAQA